tara:strand:+ start:228 stop:509 length:282 start_codon:yes stop_codon:yes gene_type:complete
MSYHEVHQAWHLLLSAKNVINREENSETAPTHDKTRHKIQLARIKKRMNVIDLAQSVGSTPEVLSSYERGEDVLSATIIANICRILDVDLKEV